MPTITPTITPKSPGLHIILSKIGLHLTFLLVPTSCGWLLSNKLSLFSSDFSDIFV